MVRRHDGRSPGEARGLNADTVTVDEGLTIKKEILEAGSLVANRGNLELFKNCKLHHSVHVSSSKGVGTDFKWILDNGKYYENDGHDYQAIQNRIIALKLLFIDSDNLEEQKDLWRQIAELKKQIRWYVSNDTVTVFYQEADVFDNIKNVGWNYVKQLRKTMSDNIFLVEVLNKTYQVAENGFYNIGEEHLYYAPNNNYLLSFDYDIEKLKRATADCRKDGDVRLDLPLKIAFDYGAAINTLVVRQTYDDTNWNINAMYVKKPKLIQDLVNEFCDYYAPHRTREVIYPYDHTATGTDGKSTSVYRQEVIAVLQARGWNVHSVNIGQAPNHHAKYMLSSTVLRANGKDRRFFKEQFNRSNCKYLLMSMQLAPLKQGDNGFYKDKGSEKIKNNPAREEATDFSDAWDTLNWYDNSDKIKNRGDFYELTFG